jgi:hypothetical protein
MFPWVLSLHLPLILRGLGDRERFVFNFLLDFFSGTKVTRKSLVWPEKKGRERVGCQQWRIYTPGNFLFFILNKIQIS